MSETRMVIPVDPRKPGLFSYVNAWEPKVNKKTNKEEGYSMALVFSKKDKVTARMVREGIDAAIDAGTAGGFEGKVMSEKMIEKFKNGDDYPLKDGDEKDDDILEGKFFINCRSKNKPGIVDADVNDILDKKLLYSGCEGVVSVTFFPYNFEGKLGVGVALNNIQVLKQGDPLGAGNKKPSEEFKAVDIDDDDDDEDYYKAKSKKKAPKNDFLD